MWHRQSSLPGPDESPNIPSIAPSIDPDAVGVYLRKYSSNMKVEACSLQPNSSVAGKNTNYVSGENSIRPDDKKITDNHHHQQQHLICSCEGACGCANQPGTSKSSQQYEGLCSQTSKILKLLASGKPCTQNMHVTSTTTIDAGSLTSIPNCDCRCRATSKSCSTSYLTQVSFISPCCSSDGGLVSEFEIVSEDASLLSNINIQKIMPKKIKRYDTNGKIRHYSSCDVESLYESIKILDTFLARHNNPNNLAASQSTALIFATPRHYDKRSNTCQQINFANRIRGWRSSDDAFTK